MWFIGGLLWLCCGLIVYGCGFARRIAPAVAKHEIQKYQNFAYSALPVRKTAAKLVISLAHLPSCHFEVELPSSHFERFLPCHFEQAKRVEKSVYIRN